MSKKRRNQKARGTVLKKRKTFTKFCAIFGQEVELKATQANKDVAREFVAEACKIIETQQYKWKPLTQRYLDRKIREGYDKRTLIRTQEYLDAISWGVTPTGRIWAGVPPHKIHQDSGLPMFVLAKIHEFGTETIPARQLWRPLISRFVRQKPKFGERYRKAIAQAMKRAG